MKKGTLPLPPPLEGSKVDFRRCKNLPDYSVMRLNAEIELFSQY